MMNLLDCLRLHFRLGWWRSWHIRADRRRCDWRRNVRRGVSGSSVLTLDALIDVGLFRLVLFPLLKRVYRGDDGRVCNIKHRLAGSLDLGLSDVLLLLLLMLLLRLGRTRRDCIRVGRVIEDVCRCPRSSSLLGGTGSVPKFIERHRPPCHSLDLGLEVFDRNTLCRVECKYPLEQVVALSRNGKDGAKKVWVGKVGPEGFV